MFVDLYNRIKCGIFEGWKDVYNQYVATGKIPDEVFQKFKSGDPTSSNKYLPWMCKQYTANPGRKAHIQDVVKLFDQQITRGVLKGEESDIYKYDLESADQIAQGKSAKVSKTRAKKNVKSESTVVEETDNYLIVVPESHGASCFYGANTKWCISGETAEHWDRYYKAGIKIYIIIDKRTNKKYAVAVGPGGTLECFDEQDDKIDLSTIEIAIGVKLSGVLKPETKKGLQFRLEKHVQQIISKCTKNPDGSYSTDGDIDLSDLRLVKLPVRFKYVGGNFYCDDNRLTSLDGVPQQVGGFYCSNNQLTTLEGAPQKVGGDFHCDNNQLTTLEGAPQKVGGYFYCDNNRLTTLEGAPQKVGGYFYCSYNQLSVKELKKTVSRDYL